jgi:hypothetical protein
MINPGDLVKFVDPIFSKDTYEVVFTYKDQDAYLLVEQETILPEEVKPFLFSLLDFDIILNATYFSFKDKVKLRYLVGRYVGFVKFDCLNKIELKTNIHKVDGCNCKTCRQYIHMAEPNQPDNLTFICYSCTQNPIRGYY